MRILIDIGHPAHVHFFKNFIREMNKKGHNIQITARNKEISLELLSKYNIDYISIGEQKHGTFNLIKEWLKRDVQIFNLARKYNPDVLVGIGNPAIAHVAKVLRKISIVFTDTEHATFANAITFPFADSVCTPSCFKKDIGKKQIRYDGYHELAYLHPNYFTPNPAVLDDLGLSPEDTIIVVRFVSWNASHDVGHHGIKDRIGLVKELERYGRVLITSEEGLPEALKQYGIQVSPERLHDLLYYATLYVGEGATTASECAVLGTHAIYVNTLGLGYIAEEEKKYHLITDFSSRPCTDSAVLARARELLENTNLKKEGKQKGEALVREKCDVTAFMVWFIEHYPESAGMVRDHPEFAGCIWRERTAYSGAGFQSER
jgi:predicted glycosyltransferase